MRAAVDLLDAEAPGIPILLDAQAHLAPWYGRFGFVVSGAPFAEDGIPHVPMRRTRLVTERLVLREWTRSADDQAFLFDMYRRLDVRRYLGDGRVMTEPAEIDALLDRWRDLADGIVGVRGVTTVSGERLGSVLFKRIPWSEGAGVGRENDVEIGWHFHPDAWGHGYATEAASALLALAHREGFARVIAVTKPANTVSGAVAQRLGMRPAGVTRDYYDTECALYVSQRDTE